MRRPPLQAPLLWQSYALCWLLGLIAAAWPLPAGMLLCLLVLLDTRLHPPRHAVRTLLALLLAGAGLLLASHLLRLPPAPAWLASALPTVPAAQRPRLCGTVHSVSGLPGERLRVLLQQVHPQGQPEQPALPGLVAWTWQNPLFTPLPGQTVCLRSAVRPVQGTRNASMQDWGLWWRAQGVHWRLWSRGNGAQARPDGSPSLSGRWRHQIKERFLRALLPEELPPAHRERWLAAHQGHAVLPALLFGDRYFLDRHVLDQFAAASLLHSLALSGQHLAIAGLLGLVCVLLAGRLWPGLYLHRPRVVLATLAACPPALLYLWLGNAPSSLLRAACMLLAMALSLTILTRRSGPLPEGLHAHLPRSTLDLLATALVVICAAAPLAVFDTGLQLSALCLFAIGISMPLLRRWLPLPRPQREGLPATPWQRLGQRLKRLGIQGARLLLLSLCIQLVLLPLNVWLLGNAGQWFFLNLLWLPVLGCLVLPGTVLGLLLSLCGLLWPARCILDICALPCQWLVDGLGLLHAHGLLELPALPRPHWTAIPGMLLLCAAVARYFSLEPATVAPCPTSPPRGHGRLLLAALVLLSVGPVLALWPRWQRPIRLDVLDVGQAQAVLLHVPGDGWLAAPQRLLVDGAGPLSPFYDPGRRLVAPILLANALPRLHSVINSHPDMDHCGGLIYILRHFRVDALYDNGRQATNRYGRAWNALTRDFPARPLFRGDRLPLGDPTLGLTLEVLHPPRGPEGQRWKGNNASLVLRLVRNGHGLALLPGDAETPALAALLDSGQNLQAEVLVAPHHGSDSAFLPAFYEAVQPRQVLVSCGFLNRYRTPSARLRNWLAQRHIPLRVTASEGQITIRWPGR